MFGSFFALRKQYPYLSFRGFFGWCQYLILFMSPSMAFRTMSIVPHVRHAYGLRSKQEFQDRYEASRIGFEEAWKSRPRETRADVEHFYLEHDKDIWRQAALSDGAYNFKKKILRAYHLIQAERLPKDSPILDYGGGAGVLVHYLARKGWTAVDIADIPSKTIQFVEQEMSGLLRRVIVADGSATLPQGHYAVISCLDVLEHAFEPLTIARNLLEALRPGGLLILSFPKETDFSTTHIRKAQDERDAVFALLNGSCDVLVPGHVFRKRG
ncbi:MAG: methyltransferase domain-containing protein [Candidatus Peribacteraceae bacterium]|jgi:2-polyprenyl-3-methyl-5-hydroxy-6-metoxy-1,4-benzoquinol methylase